MKFNYYLKDKYFSIITVLFETLLIALILKCFNGQLYLIIIIILLNLFTSFLILIYNYFRKYKFYNILINNLNKIDKKYYILETLKEP
ncbi:MAG: hypothetical protein Q4E75_01220, partial [bacterium]|nr:hypothetical protein [bacterium]